MSEPTQLGDRCSSRLAGGRGARNRREPASGAGLSRALHLPEFTSLCPITGQPDFAHFVVDYVPDARIVESKSLKLFFFSFRNHGAFHEDWHADDRQAADRAAAPQWLRIGGYWYPRGGIPIDVFYQTGEPPIGLYLPDPGVAPYRGRG